MKDVDYITHLQMSSQVRASTATWVATLPYVEFSAVMLEESSIFLTFFESENENKAAAAYALASAHQVMHFSSASYTPQLASMCSNIIVHAVQTDCTAGIQGCSEQWTG